MFKHLKKVDSGYGQYWDYAEYYDTHIMAYRDVLGEAGRLMMEVSGRPPVQLLHDGLVRKIDVDFRRSNSNVDNEADITIVYQADKVDIVAFYIGVEAFCLGQRRLGFSAVPEVDVHELVVDDGLIEHRILCHGADIPLFVRCHHLRAERDSRT